MEAKGDIEGSQAQQTEDLPTLLIHETVKLKMHLQSNLSISGQLKFSTTKKQITAKGKHKGRECCHKQREENKETESLKDGFSHELPSIGGKQNQDWWESDIVLLYVTVLSEAGESCRG